MLLDIKIILIETIIWSGLWMIMVSISVRVFPFTIEHDYPKDVREVANIPKPSKKHKMQGLIFASVNFIILFSLLVAFAILAYKGQELSFWKIFVHLWIICMTWNIVDLVIVDWLFICLLSCRYFVLPKTENCKGNKNYKFHFIGFLKGFVVMSIVAIIFTTISFFVLKLLK